MRDQRIALSAQCVATFPAGRYPNLFLIWVAPSSGHTAEDNEAAVYGIIEGLKTQKVDAQTLARVKTKLRASVVRQLDNNSGMASQLTFYYANYGDWRKLFTGLDEIDRVTADDVQRVIRQYFTTSARTVAFTVPPPASSQGAN